ncbi:MAG: tRNA (adenosine(37)-N6)-threonylcarbamoyltransferase complex transferase subunit TsaD [Acidobacteria bacterium]|nr:tRNA (adenosine(37)-N6)-threonylcarbamoyltransferase complex transferase subunit TsaD [Acidobacteriota bacterium]
MRILGIESSCDETAAAIVADGREILSSVVASQNDVHRKYGGVVPELASREHLRQIVPVVREALERANMQLPEVDAIGVTCGPGLVGSLLVGITYGKALALSLGKPLVAVNHLEGHVHAVLLEAHVAGRKPEFPAICVIVSGGHTLLYGVQSEQIHASGDHSQFALKFKYTRIGGTRDDAAGEAYDKVAKMLALGYPGGPVMDQLAAFGNPTVIRFTPPVTKGNPLDFSFSGIKTAVLRLVREHTEWQPEIAAREQALLRGERSVEQLRPLCSAATLDLIASFQESVVDDLVDRSMTAAGKFAAKSILVSGGVAANNQLRKIFEAAVKKEGKDTYFPSRALSTDNAAMIAAAAYPRLLAGELAGADLNATANLPLA